MKRKIRYIIIGFIILCIPIILIGKRIIAVDLQKEAIELLLFQKDYHTAVEKINVAIKLYPDNYLFHVTKAYILSKQNKFIESNAEIRKIFDFKNDYAEGYVAVAFNYERMNLKDSAVIEYRKALTPYNARIEKHKKNPELIYLEKSNKAFVLSLLELPEESKQLYNEIKETYPDKLVEIEQLENSNLWDYIK